MENQRVKTAFPRQKVHVVENTLENVESKGWSQQIEIGEKNDCIIFKEHKYDPKKESRANSYMENIAKPAPILFELTTKPQHRMLRPGTEDNVSNCSRQNLLRVKEIFNSHLRMNRNTMTMIDKGKEVVNFRLSNSQKNLLKTAQENHRAKKDQYADNKKKVYARYNKTMKIQRKEMVVISKKQNKMANSAISEDKKLVSVAINTDKKEKNSYK